MHHSRFIARALRRPTQVGATPTISPVLAKAVPFILSVGVAAFVSACGADSGGANDDSASSESDAGLGTGAGASFGAGATTGAGASGNYGEAGDGDGASYGTGGSGAGVPTGSNVALGGSQDIGYFRALLNAGQVPLSSDFDAAGFFAEHHTELPTPSCGERVCLEPMVGVMGNLMNGNNCSMIQLALTSPIVADLENRPPLDLAVVVDTSGSMQSGDKIGFVRDGLGMLVDGLKDGDRFSLITYESSAEVVMPMVEVIGNRAAMRSAVQSLAASGGTNLYGGLELGYQEILGDYDSSRQNRVILLSDGVPTAGITDSTSIVSMSRGYNSDGVGLTTVGLGTDFNVDLMRGLAEQADGNFYFLENSGAVEEVFTEELSYFTVPIAFDLKMGVQAGPYYAFGEAYGTSFWVNDANGGVLDVPSVFIAHRESADDVTDAGGRRGGGSALLLEFMPTVFKDDGTGASSALIATVDVEFREPGTNKIVTDTVEVNYPLPPWVTEDTGYFAGPSTETVQKSFVMLNAFVGMRNACDEFHEDPLNSSAAVGGLHALVAAMQDYNDEIGDPDIDADIELIEQLIAVMLERGTPEPEFIPVDDPWPAD